MYSSQLYAALNDAQGILVIEKNKSYSAEEVRHKIAAFEQALEKAGIHQGMRVAILPMRTADWVFILAALLLLEVNPTLIDYRADASQIVTEEECIISSEPQKDIKNCKAILLQTIVESAQLFTGDRLRYSHNNSEDTPVMTVHTSGTTGRPKKVFYTYRNLHWVLDAYYSIYRLDENDRILFSLPFHYCYSVIPSCIIPLSFGKTTVILPEGSTSRQTADYIAQNEVNIVVATPGFYKEIAKFKPETLDFHSLRICDSGGESVPPAVAKLIFEQSGIWVTEGYGLSETSSLTHFLLTDEKGTVRIGSVGKALSGVACKIVDIEGNEVEAGAIGELLIKGDAVATYEDREIISLDGWFHTGDYFYSDNDGHYYFVSRMKEATTVDVSIARLVHNIVPELVLVADVLDVAYVMQDNSYIDVMYSAKEAASGQTIEAEMVCRLPVELKNITHFRRVARIPRNTNGKVVLNEAVK